MRWDFDMFHHTDFWDRVRDYEMYQMVQEQVEEEEQKRRAGQEKPLPQVSFSMQFVPPVNILLCSLGEHKDKVTQIVMEMSGLEAEEVTELIARTPVVISWNNSRETAEGWKEKLEAAGAKIELTEYKEATDSEQYEAEYRRRNGQVYVLLDGFGEDKDNVIQAVLDTMSNWETGLTLETAKFIVASAPIAIGWYLDRAYAREVKKNLETVGAKVKLIVCDDDTDLDRWEAWSSWIDDVKETVEGDPSHREEFETLAKRYVESFHKEFNGMA